MRRIQRRGALVALVYAFWGEASACPTADSTTYAANEPVSLATVITPSPSCPNANLAYCSPSEVWVPGDANGQADPNSQYLVPPLFVLLPGSGMTPHQHGLLLKTAAFAGYRTVGLSYYNQPTLETQCTTVESPPITTCSVNYADECPFMTRWERISGVDNPATDQLVPVQDSIAYRLLDVLDTLMAEDLADGVSDWDWDNYCVPENHGTNPNGPALVDRIVWSNIVIAGFSQGAGYGHLISLSTQTDGFVSLDGGNDRCDGGANLVGYYDALTNSMANPGGASPGTGEFAVIHADHVFPGMVAPEIVPDSFAYVQLDSSVHEIDTGPLPLTHNVVRTDQSWPSGCSSHSSIAKDGCIPDASTWNNAVKDVDAAATPDDMHLFPALVEGFCNAH